MGKARAIRIQGVSKEGAMKLGRSFVHLGFFAVASAWPLGARAALLARLEAPRAPLAGEPVPVRVTLEEEGKPIDGPVEFQLQASGSAVFASEAITGEVLSGGGTSRV